SSHPAPSETHHMSPAHLSPGPPTYPTNGSDHLPIPRHTQGHRRRSKRADPTPQVDGTTLMMATSPEFPTKMAASPESPVKMQSFWAPILSLSSPA
ncbi:hypothetical protein M9458_048455, partial [Cirrhinus mrigala]